MTGLYVLVGVLGIAVALLLWMRADLKRSATARDDLAERKEADRAKAEADKAVAEARKRNEGLR